jgi:hypothetical protein
MSWKPALLGVLPHGSFSRHSSATSSAIFGALTNRRPWIHNYANKLALR